VLAPVTGNQIDGGFFKGFFRSLLDPASHYHLLQALDPKRFSEKRRPRYWAQSITMKYQAFSECTRAASTVNWRRCVPVLSPTVASNWAHFRGFSALFIDISTG
jgi:hypothetical protein